MTVTDTSQIPIQLTQGYLIASIQTELYDEVLQAFRSKLLHRLQETGARGVLLDVSAIKVIDAQAFEEFRRTFSMVKLMGARAVLVGMQPGVVSSLIDLNVNPSGMDAVLNLEVGFELLNAAQKRSIIFDEGNDPQSPEVGDDAKPEQKVDFE